MAKTGIRTGLTAVFTTSTAVVLPRPADPTHANAQSKASTCYEDLRHGLRDCHLTKEGRCKYLLPGLVENVITLDTTKAMLPDPQPQARIPRIFLRGRGPNPEFDKTILQARKVIAILVFSDMKDAIQPLLDDGITDQDLPLRKEGRFHFTSRCGKRDFPSFAAWGSAAIDRFDECQYRVVVPDVKIPLDTVGDAPNIVLYPGCGLPFFCEQINNGAQNGYSDVFKAWLQKAPPGRPAKSPDPPDKSGTPFAIKRFFKEDDFRKERENLDKLRRNPINNPHLLQHLAVCEAIPCLIFPWADGGDLKQFWELGQPAAPQGLDPNLVRWSLRQMLGLARAVKDLHSVNCRHGDIKPGNILHFSNEGGYGGRLKLADVGVAKIHVQATWDRNGGTSTRASTIAYEAPEADMEDPVAINAPRSRAYDLWSLGCVIIEFVQWHFYGNEGLTSFANDRHPRTYRFYDKVNPGGGHPITVLVHPAVDRMIRNLDNHSQYRDSVLKKVVDLARNNLLVVEPSGRLKARGLFEQLNDIVNVVG